MSTPLPGTAAGNLSQLASSLTASIEPTDTTYSYPAPGLAIPQVAPTAAQLPSLHCPGLKNAPASRTDCSGWVSWLVGQAAPRHYASVAAFRAQHFAADPCQWPRANVWYQYLLSPASAEFFQVIQPFTALQPGDIVVWALDPFADKTQYYEAHGDTGHIMVVLAPDASITQAVPQPAGTTAAYVQVSDSSSVRHASDGRRYTDPSPCAGDHPGGAGAGVITFAVNGAGGAVQFCFNATHAGNSFHAPGTDQNGQPALLVARLL